MEANNNLGLSFSIYFGVCLHRIHLNPKENILDTLTESLDLLCQKKREGPFITRLEARFELITSFKHSNSYCYTAGLEKSLGVDSLKRCTAQGTALKSWLTSSLQKMSSTRISSIQGRWH